MSIRIMSRVWDYSPYEGMTLLVCLALADYANDEGTLWPSVSSLAKKCKVSERHIARCLAQFRDEGLLEQTKKGGKYIGSSIYRFNVTHSHLDKSQGDKHDSQPANGRTSQPDRVADNPSSRNRHKEPSVCVHAQSIYAAYPRKTGKQAALKAIEKALKVTPYETLLEKVQQYAQCVGKWPKDERRFIPQPSKWFNEGRWDDDPDTWSQYQKKKRRIYE